MEVLQGHGWYFLPTLLFLTWTFDLGRCCNSNYFLLRYWSLLYCLNTHGPIQKKYGVHFVITIAVPQFVLLSLMRNLLNGQGPLNGLFQPCISLMDLFNFDWSSGRSSHFVNMWIGIPFTMLVANIMKLGLTEQIEVAEIDGGKFQIFKSITFPQIFLIMAPSLIQQFIGNINNLTIYFLTGGGPKIWILSSGFNWPLATSGPLQTDSLALKTITLASVIGIWFAISATFNLAYNKIIFIQEGC